ncbi:MAG: alpha/beta hydrolase-fold protein [Terracidiphilus sp.]
MHMVSAKHYSRWGAAVKFIVALAALITFARASAQVMPAQDSGSNAMLSPALIETECMGEQCVPDGKVSGAWEFSGILGTADWSDGAEANVVIERFDEGGVEIRRIDLPNSSSYGLTAVYKGTLHRDRVEGTVVWSWSGHWNDEHPAGRWSAEIRNTRPMPPTAQAVTIPGSMIECEADQCAPGREGGCRWSFRGREGESRCRNGAASKLEVMKADTDGIVIRRTELPSSVSVGLTALYTGKLRGNKIAGIGTWSWPGHWNNRNPGGKWFATIDDSASTVLPPVPGPLVSPEVHSDGSVTFRAFRPSSLEMFVQIDGELPVIMQKDDPGVWSLTTKPLAPDYYGYIFQDTGIPVIDPLNPLLMPNLLQSENMVHVPGPPSLPWEVSAIPHGVIHHYFFKSVAVGDERDFYVYTPPGYDSHAATKYPVLYLLHGFGQESSSWLEVAFANRILDHLIDEGKARPMIVVMPTGYGGAEILKPNAFWNDELRARNFERFKESLFNEVMPRVKHDFNVLTDRDSTAIAGLSMGAAQSSIIGLNNLDRFAWIGMFSSGGLRENFDQEFPGLNSSVNARLHLLWVSCGTDDGLLGINQRFDKWLTSEDIKHTYVETAGNHTWMVWRRNLAAFAPLLFR